MSKINISDWREFKIKDLFITYKKNKKDYVPTGASIIKRELVEGNTPRITVASINNGIVGYYNSNSKNYREYENFISVSFLGTVFYQRGRASLDMKVHCLQLKDRELNTNLGLYLATIVRETLKNSSYADQISSTVLPEIIIKLPTDKNGNPDYNYMEMYISNKINEYNKKIEEIKEIIDI